MLSDENPRKTRTKYRNEFFEDDFSYDVELNRFLLRIIGVWPAFTVSSRLESLLAITTSVLLLAFFFVPFSCHVFLVEEDSEAKLVMFGPLSFTAMAIAKYAIVLLRYEDIESCIESVANDWRHADQTICRPIMLRNAKTTRMFTKFYSAFMFGGVGFYTWILPFVSDEKNENSTDRPFAYPSEFYIFDAQRSPMYEIVFVGHSISMVAIVCTVTCGVCTITVKLVLHACSQYEIVVAFVRSVDDYYRDPDDNDVDFRGNRTKPSADFVKKRLADIIQRHCHAFECVARTEKALNETCLIDMVGSTGNIIVLGYDLIMGWEETDFAGIVTYLLLMMAFVTNVFLFCYIGECLAEQCKEVGLASYMTNWWGLPEAQAKALVLVIATSDIPVRFTAGKMANLSMQTFASVMKASVAYLNALRAML